MARITFILLFVAVFPLAAREPFGVADLWKWRSAADARISSDGSTVVFTERWNDQAANARFGNLRVAASDGSKLRVFTEGAWLDGSPCWSPENDRIAWISFRNSNWEIRVRSVNSGKDETVIAAGDEPQSLSWSAEGKYLAYSAVVRSKGSGPAWAPTAVLPYLRPSSEPPRHLFVVSSKGGTPREVTEGPESYSAPAWTLDSQFLIAVCGESEIVAVPIAGGPARVLARAKARFENPLPSPDGRKIAWLATEMRPQSYTVRRLWVMNGDGSRAKMLAGELDRDPQSPQWSSDGRTLYFLADEQGSTHVYAARNDGSVRQVTKSAERLQELSLADNGRAVTIRSSSTSAGEVASFTVDVVSEPATPASPNQHLLAERDPGGIEEVSYISEGHKVQAWIVKPPRFDPARKYPLFVDTGNAPGRMYGGEIDLRSQIFAAHGWVVLHVNPRGTPGYGEAFGNLLHSGYPNDAFQDLMHGVDSMASEPYIDTNRIAISGGLLAAWAIGHTTRFRAAVARRPIVDWATDVAMTSDGERRALERMGAMPWDDPDQYTRHSPLYFAAQVTTPTLILAGSSDPESDELYFALRQRKVETAIVRMPDERPEACVLEIETILSWLDHAAGR